VNDVQHAARQQQRTEELCVAAIRALSGQLTCTSAAAGCRGRRAAAVRAHLP
jgi:hypothetical protein